MVSKKAKSLKIKRQKLWSKNPYCEICNIFTILPEAASLIFNAPLDKLSIKVLPKNVYNSIATIDHLYTRFDPKRKMPNTNQERRLRILCMRCNWKRGVNDYMKLPKEERQKRAENKHE